MESKVQTNKVKQKKLICKNKQDFEADFKGLSSSHKFQSSNYLKDNEYTFTTKLKSIKDNITYVLKVCTQQDEELAKIMVKDIITAAGLKHPNLQEYIDVFHWDEGGFQIIVVKTDYCGNDLSNEMEKRIKKKGKFTDVEIVYILQYTYEALKQLKKIGCPHLSIKPSNILINDQGIIKITDYGYCVPNAREFLISSTTQKDMPNIYSSPEYLIARDNPEKHEGFDAEKSDMFSLGLTVLRMANLEKEEKFVGLNKLEDIQQENIQKMVKKITSRYLQGIFNATVQVDVEKRCNLQDLYKIMRRGKIEVMKQVVSSTGEDD